MEATSDEVFKRMSIIPQIVNFHWSFRPSSRVKRTMNIKGCWSFLNSFEHSVSHSSKDHECFTLNNLRGERVQHKKETMMLKRFKNRVDFHQIIPPLYNSVKQTRPFRAFALVWIYSLLNPFANMKHEPHILIHPLWPATVYCLLKYSLKLSFFPVFLFFLSSATAVFSFSHSHIFIHLSCCKYYIESSGSFGGRSKKKTKKGFMNEENENIWVLSRRSM